MGTESSVNPIPRTQRGDTPPSILSTPPTRGRTQTAYLYTPTVADPDAGEVLTWQLAGAPTGLTFNATTGVLSWLPGMGQGGSYRMTLSVRDSRGRTASQAFTLFVETQIVNTPPRFLSSALTSGVLGRAYSYAARATDADAGDVLTYLLDSGPAGMLLNASTGLVQWTPATSGSFPVVLRVRDLAGATVTQSFAISVQNLNRGPVITSTPGGSGNANATYNYVAVATDADAGDVLSWTLLTAPIGMTVNPVSGVVLWTPANSQVGTHPVTLEVRDTLGATAQQSFVVAIANTINTNSPPIITSDAVTTGRSAQPYAYDANAVDPEGQAVTFALLTSPLWLRHQSTTGLISWTPQITQVGAHSFVLQARDPQGAVALQSFTVDVTNVPPATFELLSPSVGADLTRPASIVANITDPNVGGPAITWTVKLKQPGAPDRQIGSGSGPVSNGTIATIDPTILANDSYSVEVVITKGSESIFRVLPYTVSGDLKLGQFTTSVNDLTIPLVGVPINITRNYDSLDTRTGDFGAGWRLGSFGSVVDAPTESPLQGMRPGMKVYVTTPEGRRIGFRFDPFAPAFLFPFVVTPRFTADAGVFDKLEVAETSVFLFDGIAYADFNNQWNPRRYILTTKTGMRYEIDEVNGIQLIRDRNGNTITFTPTAIISSTGMQITLARDSQGRITSIKEPSNAEIRYTYDANGNLVSVMNQLGLTTRNFYENVTFPNYLTRVEDPSGRPVTRTVYGADGRLTAVCPPAGNLSTLVGCTRITNDPAAQTQTLFNARGLRLDFVYDSRGNLLTERRYLDATTFRETLRTYDLANNVLTTRDPAGNTTSSTWDAAGNQLSKTDQANRTPPLPTIRLAMPSPP